MLEKDFYQKVEDIKFLKHILYGDSVTKDCITRIKRKNYNYVEDISFDKLWDEFSRILPVYYNNGKEYIFITDEFKSVTYDCNTDSIVLDNPKYIMRHSIDNEIIKLDTLDGNTIFMTKDHSLVIYENNTHNLIKIKPEDSDYITVLSEDIVNYNKDIYLYYGYDQFEQNPNITRKKENARLHNIRAIKIINKSYIQYNDYVYDIEIPRTHTFLANGFLVHNTDSIFLTIPHKYNENETIEDKMEIANETAKGINELIIKYTKDFLLTKCNIDPSHNCTDFESEMLMESILFISVKKNYAYKMLVKEGKILEKPKVDYKNLEVKRSNIPTMTKNILTHLVEDIALNKEVHNKVEATIEGVKYFKEQFNSAISEMRLAEISTPGKWAKNEFIINGMKIYNYIMEEEVFSPMSAGRFIYTRFNNPSLFSSNFDTKKINGICIPYDFDSDKLKQKLYEYDIEIDETKQWEKVFTTTCKKVIESIKSNYS